MCSGEVSSDRAANCEMSRFEAECLEVVVRTDPNMNVLDTTEVEQSDLLSIAATHVGIGYIELDGAVWWVLLAGSDGQAAPAQEPAQEEVMVPVVTPAVPGPDMGEDGAGWANTAKIIPECPRSRAILLLDITPRLCSCFCRDPWPVYCLVLCAVVAHGAPCIVSFLDQWYRLIAVA